MLKSGLARSIQLSVLLMSVATGASAAVTQSWLFAHKAVEDKYGVIAPWYKGQNGQVDNRIQIAVETLERWPWVKRGEHATAVVPEYFFNPNSRIAQDGKISIPKPPTDWQNGEMAQNAARLLNGLVNYYQYTGDATARALMTLIGNTYLDTCLTPANNPWPEFPITVPVNGKVYGGCNPKGFIQLDLAGNLGVALLRAYQVTGNRRWLEAVTHWGEILAEKRNRSPGAEPWGRYANPEDVYKYKRPDPKYWNSARTGNTLEGGIVYILSMYDQLIQLGEHGKGNSFISAQRAGQAYLQERLLPRWSVNSIWGHNYWDWESPTQQLTTSEWAALYLMAHQEEFPNWRNDVRNILSLFFNHTSASPASRSDVYDGAWAIPESMNCCGRSLAAGTMVFSTPLAEYGVEAHSEWGLELARRMAILSTYDVLKTGVVEDDIDGGSLNAAGWFVGIVPSVLSDLLKTMGWLPGALGANRENHIMRSTGVVNWVSYRKGRVSYSTYDAPRGSYEVLRLAFRPDRVRACGKELRAGTDGMAYEAESLKGGDYLVTIYHDGCRDIVVEGKDPQKEEKVAASGRYLFRGNQVRLLGAVGPKGGEADVYLDGKKQLAGIDFWNPKSLDAQLVYFRDGLSNGRHELRVVPLGHGNPVSGGHEIKVEWMQSSRATGESGVGAGGGPTRAQRMIFGYTGRKEYVDEEGHSWRPGTEFLTRTGTNTDTVAKAWWTRKQAPFISGTKDDPLYQYGVHWPKIVVNVTVGPGKYNLILKFAETQYTSARQRLMDIWVNGREVDSGLDVYAKAGGADRALDLEYRGIKPRNGVIEVRLKGEPVAGCSREAMLQALEVTPDMSGQSSASDSDR